MTYSDEEEMNMNCFPLQMAAFLSILFFVPPNALSVVRVFGTKGGLNQERVWLIWLIVLCGALAVMQAARFECLLFDPFALF